MGDAFVVAGRRHAVMGAERFVAARHILPGVGVEVQEGGGEAVAAMLLRRAAERPQRILQAFGEGDEALPRQARHGRNSKPENGRRK